IGITGVGAAAVAGGVGGGIVGGDLKSVVTGAITGAALAGIAGTEWSDLAKAGAMGIGGGASSAVSRGTFMSGFVAVGFTAYVGPRIGDWGKLNIVKHAVLGGAGARIGGGNFENGAATAAFMYVVAGMGGEGTAGGPTESQGTGGTA